MMNKDAIRTALDTDDEMKSWKCDGCDKKFTLAAPKRATAMHLFCVVCVEQAKGIR